MLRATVRLVIEGCGLDGNASCLFGSKCGALHRLVCVGLSRGLFKLVC